MWLHSRGHVDGVSKETVAWHLQANDAGGAGARVKSNAQLDLLFRQVLDAKLLNAVHQLQWHSRYLPGVLVAITNWQSAYDLALLMWCRQTICFITVLSRYLAKAYQIGIAYCFHLVAVVVANDRVKQCVEVIEKVHRLHGRTGAGNLRELDNVREEDGHWGKVFRFHLIASFQLIGDRSVRFVVK